MLCQFSKNCNIMSIVEITYQNGYYIFYQPYFDAAPSGRDSWYKQASYNP